MKPQRKSKSSFDLTLILSKTGNGTTTAEHCPEDRIFVQGDSADAIFYISKGRVKLTVVSDQGQEADVATLGVGDFFGEGCLAGQPLRISNATAMTQCSVTKMEKTLVVRLLHEEPSFRELFLANLVSRNNKVEQDLIHRLFTSTEKRLARVLLLMAQFGKASKSEFVIPKVSQEALAKMIGTTRSRCSVLMNRFRKLGFIDYNGDIAVRNSLLNVVLNN